MSGAAGRGAAAAALIVTLGSTAPAFAAPWAGPSLHAEHDGSHLTSGDASHDSHDAGAGADDVHEEHDGDASGQDSHDASAGADAAHEEHDGDASGHDGHDAAGSDASAGADDDHDSHDGDASAGADDGHDSHDDDASSGHDDASSEHGDDGGHGGEPDTVSAATKTRVLGGFGVVNAAAVGGAFLLRRRDRTHATKKGRTRAGLSDRNRADRDRTGRSR